MTKKVRPSVWQAPANRHGSIFPQEPTQGEIWLTWKDTPPTIRQFHKGTHTILEVPIEAVRMAAITLTELVEHVTVARITLFTNQECWLVIEHRRGGSKVWVELFANSIVVQTWELEDIDPF